MLKISYKMKDAFKIELNHNLWITIVSYLALGASEYYHLHYLWHFAFVISAIATLSVIISIIPYTIFYCMDKIKQIEELKIKKH